MATQSLPALSTTVLTLLIGMAASLLAAAVLAMTRVGRRWQRRIFGTAARSEHSERRRAALEDLLPLWIEVDHCLYRLARWDSFPSPNLRPMPQYVERGFEYTGRLREQARDSASEVGTILTDTIIRGTDIAIDCLASAQTQLRLDLASPRLDERRYRDWRESDASFRRLLRGAGVDA